MITFAIHKAIETARKRNWTKTYWAFDIHGTMIVPNYISGKIPTEFYPHAKEALQLISKRKDIVMLLFTCSQPLELLEYDAYFREFGIEFKYLNCNPEVTNNEIGYYDSKLYYNVLFEDKAGFDPETHWIEVLNLMKTLPELHN
jgi:hypothetical protein